MFLNWQILVPIALVLLFLRWRKAGTLAWSVAWMLALWVFLKFGFVTPVPASVRTIYLWIAAGSLLAYASSDRERWKEFYQQEQTEFGRVTDLIL